MPPAFASPIQSNATGNIFVFGQRISFELGDLYGSEEYTVRSYFGQSVANGLITLGENGSAEIDLTSLPCGWYQLSITPSSVPGDETTSFAVVPDQIHSPLNPNGRVCCDCATAWCVKPEDFAKIALIVRMAGIPCVRDRLRWADVQPDQGTWNWGKYDDVAADYAAYGISIDQLWQDTPQWTHPSVSSDNYPPDDLRSIYAFVNTAAAHFKGKYTSWEILDEPEEQHFFSALGDQYSAEEKVGYLAVKDADPNALVLNGALDQGWLSPFAINMYQSGVGDYSDLFNFHDYNAIDTYSSTLSDYRNGLGIGKLPVWITEAGHPLPLDPGTSKLSASERQEQCRYFATAIPSALAAGAQRYFAFILPEYSVEGPEFGILQSDLTPLPSYAALAAAAYFLGGARDGREDRNVERQVHGAGIKCLTFSTGGGTVSVLWSKETLSVTVPVGAGARVFNLFGAPLNPLSRGDGTVTVQVGPDPIYIQQGSGATIGSTTSPSPARLSRVIVDAHAIDIDQDKSLSIGTYVIDGLPGSSPGVLQSTPFHYVIDVYNFDSANTASGTVSVTLPSGWTSDKNSIPIEVLPMGRETYDLEIQPVKLTPGFQNVRVDAQTSLGNDHCVSAFDAYTQSTDDAGYTRFKPIEDLFPSSWVPLAYGGSLTVSDAGGGTTQFDASFTNVNDARFSYPLLKPTHAQDLSGYDGISFDLDVLTPDPHSRIGMKLWLPSGNSYVAYASADRPGFRHVSLLFNQMRVAPWSGTSPLNLKRITLFGIGCETQQDHFSWQVRNTQLFRLQGTPVTSTSIAPPANGITLDGVIIQGFDAETNSISLSVSSVQLPGGRTVRLATPRRKEVVISAGCSIRSTASRALQRPALLRPGSKITVIGKDSGPGTPLFASSVLLRQ